MIDRSTFVRPVLLAVVGRVIGSVLESIWCWSLFARTGPFQDSPQEWSCLGAGVLTSYAIGLLVRRGRPPLSPSSNTSIRPAIGAIFVVRGFAQDFLDVFDGAISSRLVEPTTWILVGLYLCFHRFILTRAKSAGILLTAIALVATVLYLASDYATKQYTDLAICLTVGCGAALWVCRFCSAGESAPPID